MENYETGLGNKNTFGKNAKHLALTLLVLVGLQGFVTACGDTAKTPLQPTPTPIIQPPNVEIVSPYLNLNDNSGKHEVHAAVGALINGNVICTLGHVTRSAHQLGLKDLLVRDINEIGTNTDRMDVENMNVVPDTTFLADATTNGDSIVCGSPITLSTTLAASPRLSKKGQLVAIPKEKIKKDGIKFQNGDGAEIRGTCVDKNGDLNLKDNGELVCRSPLQVGRGYSGTTIYVAKDVTWDKFFGMLSSFNPQDPYEFAIAYKQR